MHSSTAEMVEKKVLEMAQHASFHQHVSYNLSTILHAFTAGKTDPAEIAEAFSRARGLEVITRVVSGEPLARPPVISLCCGVARRVVDKFGTGVAQSQAGGLVEAIVVRLGHGVSGDDAQTVDCQVECARLMSSVAGRAASVLLEGGALGAVESMLERLGGNDSSILRPCCETLERVSRTEEGRAALVERGSGGVLLSTIREFPDALEEGSDAALASALKVVERIFTGKSPVACARALRATSEKNPAENLPYPGVSDHARCVETMLAVVDATPEAPGSAAGTCLWWLSGACNVAPERALAALLAKAARVREEDDIEEDAVADAWSWFPHQTGEEEAGATAATPRPIEAARFLAALCLSKLGLRSVEAGVAQKKSPTVEALVQLCGSMDPGLACACLRIVERLAKGSGIGAKPFVDAGALKRATEAGKRFEVVDDDAPVLDAEARAVGAALGTVAVLAEAGGRGASPLVDDAFQLSVRCLGRLGEYSGRPAAVAAKASLDVITFRLSRSDRLKSADDATVTAVTAANVAAVVPSSMDADSALGESESPEQAVTGVDAYSVEVDAPMEVLKDAGAILAAMKAHPTDVRVQEAGWRSLIAMDTGRGQVEQLLSGGGDAKGNRRQMLRNCLERHGGDSKVAGQVADILEGLVLQGDSDEDTSLTASLSEDTHGEDSPRFDNEEADGNSHFDHDGDAVDGNGLLLGAGGGSALGLGGNETPSHGIAEHEDMDVEPPAIEAGTEGSGGDADKEDTGGVAGSAPPVVEGEAGSTTQDGGEESDGGARELHSLGRHSHVRAAEGQEAASHPGFDENDEAEKNGEVSHEDMLLELSLEGKRALDGSDEEDGDEARQASTACSDADGDADGLGLDDGASSRGGSRNVARALFGAQGTEGGVPGAEGGEVMGRESSGGGALEAGQTQEEVDLEQSWSELEELHSHIVGRSQILGGESADIVAAMAVPGELKKKVGAMLEAAGVDGRQARGASAASSLAMVGALTAATGALASSQREVQRYLTMSRDLRETSTWKDISEAMQWTMDSLKGTVILFRPHTGPGLTRDLGLCKNMDSAAKLFKEAALQIKIIVVELSGEHEPNTVWRIGKGKFESIPDNRKIMMLRHLRSLVVAYDHLSDERRRELTTALEIIKNREVLNRMGKCCVAAEAVEERRSRAKIASAEEKLRIGTRRPSSSRQSPIARRSLSPNPRKAIGSLPSRSSAASSGGIAPLSFVGASTPPKGIISSFGRGIGDGSVVNGRTSPTNPHSRVSPASKKSSPPASRAKGFSHAGPKPAAGGTGGGGSTNSSATTIGSSTTVSRPRGIASKPRRRDGSMASPTSASSRSPVSGGGRWSKSPTPRNRRRSKSPVPRSKLDGASKSSPVPSPSAKGGT